MHPNFKLHLDPIDKLHNQLLESEPQISIPSNKKRLLKGVYLFSDDSKHLYVGRSNNIYQRYLQHRRQSASHNQAVFAFKIARNETGHTKAVYKKGEGNREALAKTDDFRAAFIDAKSQVRSMQFRYIEVPDQIQQTLLEIYTAIVLETPYNDFNTH